MGFRDRRGALGVRIGGVRIVCEDCLRNRLSAPYVEIGRLPKGGLRPAW